MGQKDNTEPSHRSKSMFDFIRKIFCLFEQLLRFFLFSKKTTTCLTFKERNDLWVYSYIALFIVCIYGVLDGYRVNLPYQSFMHGSLEDAGDEAYLIALDKRFNKPVLSDNIKIVLIDDKDFHIPNELTKVYENVLNSQKSIDYKKTPITPEYAKEAYCEVLHRDLSKSRQVIVEAIERVLEDKPKAIVLDILFGETSTHCPEYDEKLKKIIQQNHHIFVAAGTKSKEETTTEFEFIDPSQYIHNTVKKKEKTQTNISAELLYPFFKDVYKEDKSLNTIGAASSIVDSAIITQAKLWEENDNYLIPTLATVVSQSDCCGKASIDRYQKIPIANINWRDLEEDLSYLDNEKASGRYINHISDVAIGYSSKLPSYKDKIVFFGANLSGRSADSRYTPIQDNPVAGVIIQATILDNIIRQDFIEKVSTSWSIGYTILMIIILFIGFNGQSVLHRLGWLRRSKYRKIRKFMDRVHHIVHLEVGEANLFFILEFIAIFITLLGMLFNVYIDVSGPVLGGALSFFILTVYNVFANRHLFDNAGLLREYKNPDHRYKNIAILKIKINMQEMDSNQSNAWIYRLIQKIIYIIIGEPNNTRDAILYDFSKIVDVDITQLPLFDDDHVFGSHLETEYYWWFTDENKEDLNKKIKSFFKGITCVETDDVDVSHVYDENKDLSIEARQIFNISIK